MQLFSQLSWYFSREWKRYLGAVLILIIIAIIQLVPPKLVGILIDLIIKKDINHVKQMIIWISIMFIVAITIYILRYIWRILLFGAAYKLAVELRSKFYLYLSQQNINFYLNNRTGDLIAKATNDVDRVVFASGEGVLTLIDSLVMGILVLMVMSIQISWKLTLISLFPMPIMAFFIKKYGKKLHENFLKAQFSFSLLNSQTQESLSSIHMIRAFGLEYHQFKKFNTILEDIEKKNMEVAKIDALFDPTIHLSISLSNLLAIMGGSWLIWKNEITLGELTSFIMYLGLMIWPMLALAWMCNIVERGSAAWDRIKNIINYKNVVFYDVKKENVISNIISKNLKINIHEFYYPNNTFASLKNIYVSLDSGKTLGICGPTGSGKSTLIHLIQRNFDIKKGQISYGNYEISKFKIEEWRSHISVVNQTPFLFSDTIINNIKLGKPNASIKEIETAAKIAHIHNDIIRFPEGYNTQVGEKGVTLSGGQKQRISIARAILPATKILILDDAFSSVDAYTEYKILKNINTWKKNKHTVIISANRLSSLQNSDFIIVMKNGCILQKGQHNTLMQEENWYKTMYCFQQSTQ